MSVETVHLNGKAYVIVEREEYERLGTLAKAAELPALPEPDEDGNYPALEYVRATIARGIIRDRVAAGMSQRELARRAGVRVETVCRIETGKHTPSLATVEKIERALNQRNSGVRKSGRRATARAKSGDARRPGKAPARLAKESQRAPPNEVGAGKMRGATRPELESH